MESAVVRVSYECVCVFFFFSSRRRHTRFDCDWSSDVCSSDLLSDVLARGGITGREYVRFMRATHSLNPRRMQPGLIFELRRLKGAAVANRLGVRLDPESHLVMSRLGGDSGWTETVEEIPWTAERLRTTAVIQSNLYDALDAAIPDSFLPIRSEEHTSELQSQSNLVCRLLLEKKNKNKSPPIDPAPHPRIPAAPAPASPPPKLPARDPLSRDRTPRGPEAPAPQMLSTNSEDPS